MIKNANIYNVKMPSVEDMNVLLSLEKNQISKPLAHEFATTGFTVHPITKQFVSEFKDGYCLTLKVYEKKISKKTVDELFKEQVSKELKQQGRKKLTKEENLLIKERIVMKLLPGVPPTPKLIYGYYDIKNNRMIVDAASQKSTDLFMLKLVDTVGSLEGKTLYVSNRKGVDETFIKVLKGQEQYLIDANLDLDDRLELIGNNNEKMVFKDVNLKDPGTTEEILCQIEEAGFTVKNIGIKTTCSDYFKFEDGKYKAIKFRLPKIDKEEDDYSRWKIETNITVAKIVSWSKRVLKRFDMLPPLDNEEG